LANFIDNSLHKENSLIFPNRSTTYRPIL
jgi:hypothetical protein